MHSIQAGNITILSLHKAEIRPRSGATMFAPTRVYHKIKKFAYCLVVKKFILFYDLKSVS